MGLSSMNQPSTQNCASQRTRRIVVCLPLVLGLGLFSSGDANAATLERAPYLHQTSPSSTIIVWRTYEASSGEIRVGASPDALDVTVPSPAQARQHEVLVPNLSPGTRYYYAVYGDNELLAGGDLQHYFDTAPPVGTRSKIRAWVVGDSGSAGPVQYAVRDAMLAKVGDYRPQMQLQMGDMAYPDGSDSEFTEHFYTPYASILRNSTLWPTIGNHEGVNSESDDQSGPYYEGYVLPTAGEVGGVPSGTEAYYSFDYGNAHFIVLNSYDSPREPEGAMLQWLTMDLQATDQEWLIAFWHHPPYTKGTHDSDEEFVHVQMRQWAVPLLEAAGVDMVLGGHSHTYERSYLLNGAYETPTTAAGILSATDGRAAGDGPYTKAPGAANAGAIYVVAGHGARSTGGSGDHPVMYFSELENGSCILDIHENRLSMINIRMDGQISDQVSLIKGDGIEIFAPNGGESLPVNMDTEIQWATVGDIPEVKIEYSLNDGSSWNTIVDATPNTGSHTWTVPAFGTQNGLIRVSSTEDAALRDESNAGFKTGGGAMYDLVDWGGDWSYNDQGVDLGDAWLQSGYDFGGWPTGAGQLGYGDGDETTVLNDPDPNHPSTYFLKSVDLGAEVGEAQLEVLFDDGAAVWINGHLVAAVNANDLSYGAFASNQSQDNEVYTTSINLDPSPFVVGQNIIGAMVKQGNESSSDLSFDLKLSITESLPTMPDTGGETDGETTGSTDGGESAGTDGTDGGSAGTAGTGETTGSAGSAGTGGTGDSSVTATASDATTSDPGIDDESGCSCRADGDAPAGLGFLVLGCIAGVRRARRVRPSKSGMTRK